MKDSACSKQLRRSAVGASCTVIAMYANESGNAGGMPPFPRYTPVEVIADMGGVRSSCTVTDLRQLTSTEEICRYAPGTDRDVRACGHFTANQAAATGRDDQKMREINPAVD